MTSAWRKQYATCWASWRLNMDANGKISVIRGLDILEFKGDKLVKKLAYMKADTPHLES